MRHRIVSVILVGASAAAVMAGPRVALASASLVTPPATWWVQTPTGTVSASAPPQAFAGAAVGDLFGDGKKEVIAGFPDGSVRAWDSLGHPVPGWPRNVGAAINENPTLVDLAGNGKLEVVITAENGTVNVFNGDGSNYGNGWPQSTWDHVKNFPPGFFGTVAAGDLFGTGHMDLVAASWDHELYAWDSTGHWLPGFPKKLWDTIWDTPTLVDLEHTRQLDIVIGSDSSGGKTEPYPPGGVYWAFRPNGSLLPGWPKTTNQVPWASTAAAPISNNGWDQVIAGSGHFYNSPAGQQDFAWNHDGSVVSGWPQATGGRNFASPAIGVLGNGQLDVVQMSENGLLYAWDPSGHPLAGWPVDPGIPAELNPPVIAPVDDGSGHNGVWVVTENHVYGYSANGTLVDEMTLPGSGPGSASPTVADLGNGHLSIIDVNQAYASSTKSWDVSVFPINGATALYPGAWPTFHGTNLHAGTGPPAMPCTNVVAVTGASGAATITWTPPTYPGYSAITSYTITTYDAQGNVVGTPTTGSSPLTVPGLTNGVPYYFGVAGNNAQGAGPVAESNSVTPFSGATPPAQLTAPERQSVRAAQQ